MAETRLSVKEKLRMALAEAGYPDAELTGEDDNPWVDVCVGRLRKGEVPPRVAHRAFRLVDERGLTPECYECWASREQLCPEHTGAEA